MKLNTITENKSVGILSGSKQKITIQNKSILSQTTRTNVNHVEKDQFLVLKHIQSMNVFHGLNMPNIQIFDIFDKYFSNY